MKLNLTESLRCFEVWTFRAGNFERAAFKVVSDEMKRLRRIERAARKWDKAGGSVIARADAVIELERVLAATKRKGKR